MAGAPAPRAPRERGAWPGGQVHPASKHQPHHLDYFRFIGRVLGKAVFDGFLVESHLASTIYKYLLGLEIAPCDMASVDPVYFKNLQAPPDAPPPPRRR